MADLQKSGNRRNALAYISATDRCCRIEGENKSAASMRQFAPAHALYLLNDVYPVRALVRRLAGCDTSQRGLVLGPFENVGVVLADGIPFWRAMVLWGCQSITASNSAIGSDMAATPGRPSTLPFSVLLGIPISSFSS